MQDNNYNEFNDQYSVEQGYDQVNNENNQQYYQDQAYYDQYYGGTNMQYNADQITNYEQAYDTNSYQNYYDAYYKTTTDVASQQQYYQELYAYYINNFEQMKQAFPKKKKIIRWEDIASQYNSLEAANEFIDLLNQQQEQQLSQQTATRNQEKEFADVLNNDNNPYGYNY